MYADFSYLLVLGASLGAVLVLGALSAPVIFNTDKLLAGVLLDNYNAGMIMAEIFRRFTYWLYFLTVFVVAYEVVQYKMGQRDAIMMASASMVIFSSLMFNVVYVPKILSMQALGAEATRSDTFSNIHLASEIDSKLLAISLVVLFIRRLMLMKID